MRHVPAFLLRPKANKKAGQLGAGWLCWALCVRQHEFLPLLLTGIKTQMWGGRFPEKIGVAKGNEKSRPDVRV
jgi:hypothetical protein